jgi:transcriptional regulator of acetoin/glycerol metabolism
MAILFSTYRDRVTSYLLHPPTMPPIRTQNAQKPIEQEEKILLAIKAIQNQEIGNISEAASLLGVPRTTLTGRLTGHTY